MQEKERARRVVLISRCKHVVNASVPDAKLWSFKDAEAIGYVVEMEFYLLQDLVGTRKDWHREALSAPEAKRRERLNAICWHSKSDI